MTIWDFLLIAVVTGQALTASYVFDPKWKALVYGLPFPFTFALLSVGQPVNVQSILSLVLMFGFMQLVRIAHLKLGIPLIAAILMSAIAYCAAGWLLVQVVPVRESWFWWGSLLAMLLAYALNRLLPVRIEPGERTALPPWVKVPLTLVLVILLVLAKSELQGFITFFPMVGVFVAYEARRSLWTMGRQTTIVMLTVLPMVAAIHLLTPEIGLGYAVLCGWAVFLAMFGLMKIFTGANRPAAAEISKAG